MRKLGQTGKIIAIAAALGLVTAVLVYLYVSGLAAVPEAEPVQLAQVVIAKQDLTPRTVITPDVVRIAQVPVDTIHPKGSRIERVMANSTKACPCSSRRSHRIKHHCLPLQPFLKKRETMYRLPLM